MVISNPKLDAPGTDLMSGRRAFITGAGGGIGGATARRFGEEGAAVVLADLDQDAVERVAAELRREGIEAYGQGLDVTDDDGVAAAIDHAADRLGGLDALVANAGVLTMGKLEDTTVASFRRTIDINLVGTFSCLRHALPHLRAAGDATIVCTASQAGIEGAPELISYCASKFGVVGIVETLARELAAHGIRVNGVAPGLVDTPMLRSFFEERAAIRGMSAEEIERKALADVPMQRLATAVEVGNSILFLSSQLGSYVSGVTLPVLGGELS